jgi:hypothetical protein
MPPIVPLNSLGYPQVLLTAKASKNIGHRFGSTGLQVRNPGAVGIQRDDDGRMAQTVADYLGVDVRLKEQDSASVPQAVERRMYPPPPCESVPKRGGQNWTYWVKCRCSASTSRFCIIRPTRLVQSLRSNKRQNSPQAA